MAASALANMPVQVVAAQFGGFAAADENRRATAAVQSWRSRDREFAAAAGGGAVQWKTAQCTKKRGVVVVRAEAGGEVSASTSAAVVTETGGVTEVDKDTFWPIVKSAGEKLVVLDMYTQWCGPCKLIFPKIQALAATMDDVIFCKLDCNQENKPLAKELGIKVVPTFKIFKAGELVTSITGAKYENLLAAIKSAREGQ